jgi:hypothetical protein
VWQFAEAVNPVLTAVGQVRAEVAPVAEDAADRDLSRGQLHGLPPARNKR